MNNIARVEKLKLMLQEQPTDSFLLFALGLEMMKAGEMKEAESLFRTIMTHDPNYCGVYYHLGKLLEREDRVDEAMLVYDQGLLICKKLNEQHNYNELRSAKDNLLDD
jgi:Flp pilus assembly protein TadD